MSAETLMTAVSNEMTTESSMSSETSEYSTSDSESSGTSEYNASDLEPSDTSEYSTSDPKSYSMLDDSVTMREPTETDSGIECSEMIPSRIIFSSNESSESSGISLTYNSSDEANNPVEMEIIQHPEANASDAFSLTSSELEEDDDLKKL